MASAFPPPTGRSDMMELDDIRQGTKVRMDVTILYKPCALNLQISLRGQGLAVRDTPRTELLVPMLAKESLE